MSRRSVRFRLTAWYSAILAATLAAAGYGLWWELRDSIHETVDRDLRSRLKGMRDYLQREVADKESGPLAQELAEQAAMAPAGTRYRIAGADGHWIYESPGTSGWYPSPDSLSPMTSKGKAQTIHDGSMPVRILSAPVPMGIIQIGIPIDEFYEMLDAFTWTCILASPLLLLLAAAGGYWMSRRALAPVDRITRTAGEIEARNLSQRLPLRGTMDELDRLSATLNSMFARLEAAFQRMAQFTADASHELRTPVAIIRTTAEVARSRPRSEEEYARVLDRILLESERTTALIEDLMLLARADAGADGIQFEPVNVANAVRESLQEARVLADAGKVRMEADLSTECIVSGDFQALRRLFLILVDNAIKYTPPGGEVRVHIKVEHNPPSPAAVIAVRDTGIGISAEDLPHIFERFYRTAKDRSRKTGGAGLGLSIARWIAAKHGGEISVESVVGAGSVFRMKLPLTASQPVPKRAETLTSSI